MLNGNEREFVLGAFAAAAGAVWLYAGVAKILRPLTRADLSALAPPLVRLHPVLRWAVPCIEVAIGVALLSGTQPRAAGIVGTLLGATFALLHLTAMVRAGLSDRPLSSGCSCFGRIGVGMVPTSHAALNARLASALDVAAIEARGWQWAKAASLTILTWTATLPCGACGG
jgi:hypothetical protein